MSFIKLWIAILLLCATNIIGQEVENTKALKINQFGIYDTDLLPASFHKKNREKLRSFMPNNSVAVFFSSPVKNRSNDVDFQYHQDPNFYYLTGLREPHSILILLKTPVDINGEQTNEVLFVQPKDESKEIWTGKRIGKIGAELLLEVETALDNTTFNAIDFNFEEFDQVFHFPLATDIKDNPFDKSDLNNLCLQFGAKLSKTEPDKINQSKPFEWLNRLREIKTEEELVLMRKAIAITCEAQIELIKALEPNMTEFQSEAIIEYIFKSNGAEYPGFPSILGSGENSCVLHYNTNRKTMTGDNLLVSDVGAEYHGYTADVTRTIPVNGTFSQEQKIIYDIVLKAQEAGIKKCKEGNSFWDPNIAATSVVSQELQKLGIIKSPIGVRKYFMHGTSHYLGLDVHDVGTYLPLKVNSVITVEPGIYIPEGSPCDKKWWNIGVRIEDDVLITSDKPEVLSDCIPKTTNEIEKLMKEPSVFNRKNK